LTRGSSADSLSSFGGVVSAGVVSGASSVAAGVVSAAGGELAQPRLMTATTMTAYPSIDL
jgi:hypothetical protein